MASSNIEKMLNVLDDNETGINKIANVSHHFLLASSMKNAREIIQKREANGKIFNKDEKKIFFNELFNLIYEEKLKLLKEELLKQRFFIYFSEIIV